MIHTYKPHLGRGNCNLPIVIRGTGGGHSKRVSPIPQQSNLTPHQLRFKERINKVWNEIKHKEVMYSNFFPNPQQKLHQLSRGRINEFDTIKKNLQNELRELKTKQQELLRIGVINQSQYDINMNTIREKELAFNLKDRYEPEVLEEYLNLLKDNIDIQYERHMESNIPTREQIITTDIVPIKEEEYESF